MPLQPDGAVRSLREEEEIQAFRAERGRHTFGAQGDPPSQFASRGFILSEHARFRGELFAQPWEMQHRPVRKGAIDAFVKTCQRWRLSTQEQTVLLGYDGNPLLASEILSGRYLSLPQDVKDRIGYVVGISVGLGTVFDESVAAELAWLNRPHSKLRNSSPRSFILRGQMAQLIAVSTLVDEERSLR